MPRWCALLKRPRSLRSHPSPSTPRSRRHCVSRRRTVHAVMNELLPSLERLRRSFDDLRYGGFSSIHWWDSARSRHSIDRVFPRGARRCMPGQVSFEHPDGRSWDETEHEYAQRMLERMGRSSRTSKPRTFFSSTATARRHGAHLVELKRDDLHRIATTSYQSGAHRPTPGLGQLTVPGVERLSLVRPFQRAGGRMFGAGRGAAMKFMEDTKANVSGVTRRDCVECSSSP